MDVYAKHRPPAGTFFRSVVAFIAALTALPSGAADFYVRPPGTTSTDASPYDTWEKAATQIQWAVNVAMTNLPATVWVTNGTYRVTNEVAITNGVTLKSVSGYTKTLVCADWPTYTTRVFNIANRAAVDGFAISNGHVTTNILTGGGVYMASTSVLRNCYVLHNVALNSHGGGIFSAGGAIVSNCIIFSPPQQNLWVNSGSGSLPSV